MIACCAAVLLTACGSAPKERFYTLDSISPVAAGNAAGSNASYRVAIGPVKVPDTVDRPQLVVRRSPNRVDVLEQHRWAEPLRTEIARVLAADIGIRLNQAQVTTYNDYAGRNPDYRILIDVERFDGTPGDAVTVQAVWTIRRTAGETSKSGRSVAREAVGKDGYEELAAAYGRALSVVAADIGNAVQAFQSTEKQ